MTLSPVSFEPYWEVTTTLRKKKPQAVKVGGGISTVSLSLPIEVPGLELVKPPSEFQNHSYL